MSKYGVFSGPYFPVFGLNRKIYSVIRRFTIWTLYCYNQKQSLGAVLQKSCSYKFRKIHKKTPKKRFRHRCFLVNSAKFSITSFLKNASGGFFSINTRYVYCPTLTFCLFKNDVTHIFWLSVFFDLACRLRIKVSSIFQALSQKSIFNSVDICDRAFLGKNSLQLKTVKYFSKKVPL